MTYNATSRKDIRAAEKSAALEERSRIEFLVLSMNTIPGRQWFYDLLTTCQIFSVAPVFSGPHDYFALGQRNVGMRIWSDILTHCPDQYILMMKEANVRLASAAKRDRSSDPGRDPQGHPGPDAVDDTPDLFGDNFADYGVADE